MIYICCAHTDAPLNDPVTFIPSMDDLPDPPDWMTFKQRDLLTDGILFGTPESVSGSAFLEVSHEH